MIRVAHFSTNAPACTVSNLLILHPVALLHFPRHQLPCCPAPSIAEEKWEVRAYRSCLFTGQVSRGNRQSAIFDACPKSLFHCNDYVYQNLNFLNKNLFRSFSTLKCHQSSWHSPYYSWVLYIQGFQPVITYDIWPHIIVKFIWFVLTHCWCRYIPDTFVVGCCGSFVTCHVE